MSIDWGRTHEEAMGHLRALLRIDTTNPPGNEIEAARYVAGVLDSEGIPSIIKESGPGRANLVARLDGGDPDGALLLTAHLDVVPAEPERWTHPPFAAEVADGYVWGRGAIDMKNMAVYGLMSLLLAKRTGLSLRHDLALVCVADEEAGCFEGSRWLVKHHPELLRGRYALNELGGFTIHLGGERLYPIQLACKGFAWVRMTARGEPGHGSMPHDSNAVVRLARALQRVDERLLPFHLHPVMSRFMEEAGRALGFPASLVLKAARSAPLSNFVLQKLLPDPERRKVFLASLHNTANPTGLQAGYKENVVPSSASATLDCRMLPGFTTAQLMDELRAVVGDEVELEVLREGPPSETDGDTEMYRLLETVLRERDPGCRVAPYLVVGFTDAIAWQELGLQTYGFTPIRLPPDLPFASLYHGHDERIPVEGFRWGLETFWEVVRRYCGA